MKKSVLEKFIARYNLNGAAESVKWESTPTGLFTKFASDDLNVIGFVDTTDSDAMGLDSGEYLIYDTAKLSSLLRVLDDDITISVKEYNGVPSSFNFRDSNGTKVTAVLAVSEDVIPKVPNPNKALPPMELEIVIDQRFVSTFARAKSALRPEEGAIFTVVSDGVIAEIVLGFDQANNTDRIAIKVDTKTNAVVGPIHFNADYFRSILTVNKDLESTLRVSSKGLAHIAFAPDKWNIQYFLTASRK